jgi:RNA polymerase nonessential primary-like sigma factor
VRIPVHAQETARTPKDARGERIRDEVEAVRATYSLDQSVDLADNARTTLCDMIADAGIDRVDDALERTQAAAFVEESIKLLPLRERQVIEMRYVRGMALADVGAQLGLSREGVRQVEMKALARIRARVVA